MHQILWLAPHVPYSNISHAGGKNLNYYMKYINDSGKFNIHFIGLGYIQEKKKVTLSDNGISTDIYYRDNSRIDSFLRRFVSAFSLINPYTKYYHLLLCYEHHQLIKRIKKYKKAQNSSPDIIILHWTAMALLLPELKKMFPDSKYLIVEEDVTYLSYKRKYDAAKKHSSSSHWKRFYHNLKKDELNAISNADLTVTLNEKDRKLLLSDGIPPEKVFTAALYIDSHSDVVRKPDNNSLLFYGAMNRPENYESVLWFIQNVMPKLSPDITLEVVGARPPQMLYKNLPSNVHIRGFVEDISPYLSGCMCMVAPLVLGAGIKAKVLEAMSAGIPVLTNEIGIEGIDARDKIEYFFCSSPDEYITTIEKLCSEPETVKRIGENGKKFFESSFDVNKKLDTLVDFLLR